VCVLDAKDHGHLGMPQLGEMIEGMCAALRGLGRGVGCFMGTKRAGMDICRKVGHAGGDTRVELPPPV
jgi:hypothetical protein